MEAKSIFWSKTFWVNLVGIGAMAIQSKTGFILNAEEQMAILAVINVALRAVTKVPVKW